MSSPGDVDILLKDEKGRAFPERVMLFQQIEYGCLDDKGKIEGRQEKDEYVRPWTCSPGRRGQIESDDHDWGWQFSGRFTGINGKVQPRLEAARAGRFERWRLIHGGTRERIRMHIRPLHPSAPDLATVVGADQEHWVERYCGKIRVPAWKIAMDGLTRSSVRRVDEVVLFPGDRTDVLALFPAAGRYCVTQETPRDGPLRPPPRVLAVIEARGPAPAAADADSRLQSILIRAAERQLAGAARTAMRDKVVAELSDGLKLTSFTWHKPVTEDEISGYREAIVNIVETPKAAFFHINGRAYDHGRIDHVLPLGKAEEWRAVSLLGNHPLHMHVNPFQIVSIEDVKGRDVTDPSGEAFDPDYAGLKGEWKDTVMLKQDLRVAFRTRYERFTGDFVTHCHIMFHGDHGMMQNLRIAAEGQESTKVAEHSAH